MLVLSRLKGESIVIGTGAKAVVVTVLGIRGNKVSLGVQAPKDVSVHREEVYKQVFEEQEQAK